MLRELDGHDRSSRTRDREKEMSQVALEMVRRQKVRDGFRVLVSLAPLNLDYRDEF